MIRIQRMKAVAAAAALATLLVVVSSVPAIAASSGNVGGNPRGCVGYVENAHKSGGMASVHGGIRNCTSAPTERFVSVTLQKRGWFQWHNTKTYTGYLAQSDGVKKLDVDSKAVCGNTSLQTWRGETSARVTVGSTHYYGSYVSASETRFACDA